MFHKPLVRVVLAAALAVAGYTIYMMGVRSGSRSAVRHPAPNVSTIPQASNSTPLSASEASNNDPKRTLGQLVERCNKILATESGENRQTSLQSLCEDAITQLGATNDLAKFLDFINTRGMKAQAEWILNQGLRILFSGPQAGQARAQMLEVTDDSLRTRCCQRAGEGFGALGFKEYLDSFTGGPHAACQSPLLAGRCMTLAKTDLESAVIAYRELKTSTINPGCLGDALAEAFTNTSYADAKTALAALPDEEKQEAMGALRYKPGNHVAPYLAALDHILHTEDWQKNESGLCVKLHNLVLVSNDYETMLGWAAILPERKDTENLYRVAVRGFVTYKRDRVRPWIDAMPPGWKQQNSLAAYMQSSLMTYGDVSAAQWARARITEPPFTIEADGWILEYEKRSGKPYPR